MTQLFEHINDDECRRFQGSLELVGQRWSSGILLALARGATRFSEIVASVQGLSDRMLAQRLKQLAEAGLVERSIVATTPVQVRYSLTEKGQSLMTSLEPLAEWGQIWAPSLTPPVTERHLDALEAEVARARRAPVSRHEEIA